MKRFNNRHFWKIKYYNEEHEEKSVKILPRLYDHQFEDFKNVVQLKNKDVKIINW